MSKAIYMYKMQYKLMLSNVQPKKATEIHNYNIKNKENIFVQQVNTMIHGTNSILMNMIKMYNEIPPEILHITTLHKCKKRIQERFIAEYVIHEI
jgi:hypothetical protein